MRQWIVVIFLLLSLCGCAKKDPLSMIIKSMETHDYISESEYVDCRLEIKELSDNVYRYRIVIDQPKANLDNLTAVVLCDYMMGDAIPSIGIFENDKCNLYINKLDIEEHYYEGVSLMGLTNSDSVSCQLYLSFEVEDKKIEEFVLLEGNINDAP